MLLPTPTVADTVGIWQLKIAIGIQQTWNFTMISVFLLVLQVTQDAETCVGTNGDEQIGKFHSWARPISC